jgi:hypothetical protein
MAMAEKTRTSAEQPGEEPFDESELGEVVERLGAPGAAAQPQVSGLYKRRERSGSLRAAGGLGEELAEELDEEPRDSAALLPAGILREELRLDVDGWYPQNLASGALITRLGPAVQWIAPLRQSAQNHWSGPILYKQGDASSFPYTDVEIRVRPNQPGRRGRAKLSFLAPGGGRRVVGFRYRSPHFHRVEFEFDHTDDSFALTRIRTHAHPNRPPTLQSERLSIETVYQRAGFDVRKSGGDGQIPVTDSGADTLWTDLEMHDAMQSYCSRFCNRARWSLWVLFARQHVSGASLGGIMFDDIGPNHRQGTAMFNDSFISDAPAGDPAPNAWQARMRFWTAVHEMGHAFNLAHSWQKSLGNPWIPLADEPDARSFMNYPYNQPQPGGEQSFFSDFEYRFSDAELIFLRHAPSQYVQMGNADWFDDHGFREAKVSPQPALALALRVNRPSPVFEFMEPVMLELKLTNISSQPQLVDSRVLENREQLAIVAKRDSRPARQLLPYARYCTQSDKRVLQPGESLYESLFAGVSLSDWVLAEPGDYLVQASLQLAEEDVVSPPLRLRIRPETSFEEKRLAQDFFTEDVGRALTFDGSVALSGAMDALNAVAEQLGDRPVADHARIAIANACARPYKQLAIGGDPADLRSILEVGEITVSATRKDPVQARKHIQSALVSRSEAAAQSLGHLDYHYYGNLFERWLREEEGDSAAARDLREEVHKTLITRKVPKRYLED